MSAREKSNSFSSSNWTFLRIRQATVDHFLQGIFFVQGVTRHGHKLTVNAQDRRHGIGQMKIRRILMNSGKKKFPQLNGHNDSFGSFDPFLNAANPFTDPFLRRTERQAQIALPRRTRHPG
jgi:hypothetical protein